MSAEAVGDSRAGSCLKDTSLGVRRGIRPSAHSFVSRGLVGASAKAEMSMLDGGDGLAGICLVDSEEVGVSSRQSVEDVGASFSSRLETVRLGSDSADDESEADGSAQGFAGTMCASGTKSRHGRDEHSKHCVEKPPAAQRDHQQDLC